MTAQRLTEAVTNAEGAALVLDQELADVDGLQLGLLVDALARLRAARTSLQRSEAAIERAVVAWFRELRAGDRVEFPGVGVVEVKHGTDRKRWDHEALAKVWLESWLTDRGGELPSPWDVRDGLMEVAALSYWRATVLRRYGIDPDEYCEASPGNARVIIT